MEIIYRWKNRQGVTSIVSHLETDRGSMTLNTCETASRLLLRDSVGTFLKC